MKLFKSAKASAESASSDRRSFISGIAAGVSGVLASTAAIAGTESGSSGTLAMKLALLGEERALRKLHQDFEQSVDNRRYQDVIGMFVEDAEVEFDGAVFAGRDDGVSRLYRERFAAGQSGKRMEPAPGFELDAEQLKDSVEVSPDRLSAKAAFPYSIRVAEPVETGNSLASMARLQGEGVRAWWEGGVYDVSYARESVEDRWRIRRLEYRTLSRADYRSGRSWAKPLS